jgi:hypothetical protein
LHFKLFRELLSEYLSKSPNSEAIKFRGMLMDDLLAISDSRTKDLEMKPDSIIILRVVKRIIKSIAESNFQIVRSYMI